MVNRGYKVGTAHTGEEAIAKAQESMHDIFFIDMKLPTINGLETYLAIKEINPEAVSIIITGYREETCHLVDQAISHSAHACLYKPLDLAKMLDLVDEIGARKRKTGLLSGRKR